MAQNNRVFINLPGEPWNYSTFNGQLDVILRRHRDVIININLPSPFSKFTLEADKDWFYDTQSKKRTNKMEYGNGQRVHLWIGRDFKGSLLLKSGKLVYANFQIEKIFQFEKKDAQFSDYTYKPAPLIFDANKDNQPEKGMVVPGQDAMHIVEVRSESNAPAYVINAIRSGAESLNIDSQDVISLNWIVGQIAGVAGYGMDNAAWIKELKDKKIRLQRVMHKSGSKVYIIFKGSPKSRALLTAARYAADNTKVLSILAGAGSFKGSAKAAWNAANPSLTSGAGLKLRPTGAGIAILFSVAISVAEWYADYSQLDKNGKPKKDFFDLAAIMGIGLIKVAVSGAAASGIVSLAAAAGLVVMGLTPFGIAIGVFAVAVSIGVGLVVDYNDKIFGITEKAASGLRDSWSYLKKKEPNSYDLTFKPYGLSGNLHPASNYPAMASR